MNCIQNVARKYSLPSTVDTSTKMKECALTLLRSVHDGTLTELAFDIEAYNQSKYQLVTCLIQLCTNTGFGIHD